MTRISNLLPALLLAMAVQAQQAEAWQALRSQPRATMQDMQRTGGLNEYFVYLYQPQGLPVVDDFSVDRTRHLDAQAGDADVTYITTVHKYRSGGIPLPAGLYATDASLRNTYDPVLDTVIITANPVIPTQRFDITTYPSPAPEDISLWPAYTILDTIGDADPDTIRPPQFVGATTAQDSLLVYEVAANTATYINPDNSMQPLILWQEDEAYINGTYPIDPPSIGVATLDGMDRTGYPYQPENPNMEGIGDHLTSVPINLLGIASDSVYLSFYYEPRGLSGDIEVDPTDSLRLEFYAVQEDRWYLEWSTPYTNAGTTFQLAMIPIVLDKFLKNGFRMRFSSRATLGGPVDQWHIDYVRLGKQRAHDDTVLQDVAITYPANTMLAGHTSVPFNRFTANPGAYMASQVELTQKNLFTNDALITWGYQVSTDCGSSASFTGPGNSITNNAGTTFTATRPINSNPHFYTYDLSGCTDAAFATTKFWTLANPDAMRYNDTTTLVQEISNYYSYDDGSAEQSYFFNSACTGCQLAYRFETPVTDSVRALRIYFSPIFSYADIYNDPRDASFLLTVWGSDLNAPHLFQNITFSNTEYRRWGPDYFVEYPLDDTIAVTGIFHVGFMQTNGTKFHIGLDKNIVANQHMFYNTGNGWQQSQAPGSWMMRPVMVSAADPFASVQEHASSSAMQLFPNPASEEVRVRIASGAHNIELLDATGRRVLAQRYQPETSLSLAGAASGVYLVRATGVDGSTLAQERLIVQAR